MTDLVTIIVPCYNAAKWLEDCVESILRQEDCLLEVILVNDGSDDDTGQICDMFARQDSRVTVIHQENSGVSAARNIALDAANGSLVMFVDADDSIDLRLVSHLYGMLQRHRADIACCAFIRISDGNQPNPLSSAACSETDVIEWTPAEAIDQIVSPQFGSMVAPWGKLYRTWLFDDIRFPVGRKFEDEFTTYQTILRSNKIIQSPCKLYHYRQHSESAMAAPFSIRGALDAIDGRLERAAALRAHGMIAAAQTSSGQVLSTYMRLLEHTSEDEHDLDVKKLATRLGREPQPMRFRLFYQLAALAPALAIRVFARLRRPASPPDA